MDEPAAELILRVIPCQDPETSNETLDEQATASRIPGLLISFKDINYEVVSGGLFGVQRRIKLVTEVSGSFYAGQMAAIMGPIGSGKTALLDVLAGRNTAGKLTGSIAFSGIAPTVAFYRRYVGYVEQFDALLGSLTVKEMLLYAAELKRPMAEPFCKKRAAVDLLLSRLALKQCQDVNIAMGRKWGSGISAGQAKRTSIAIALITDPRVLFLDEPTSMLDSFTAVDVMVVLKELANLGMTVCVSMHTASPASFRMLDRLLLMLRGRVVYFGEPGLQATGYFGTIELKVAAQGPEESQAEWLETMISLADREGRSLALADAYSNSTLRGANDFICSQALALPKVDEDTSTTAQDMPVCPETVTPWWWAFWILIKYRTLTDYQTSEFLVRRVGDKLIFNFIMMSLYWGVGSSVTLYNISDVTACLAMWCMLPLFGTVVYTAAIKRDHYLFIRERSAGLYRVSTYLLFKLANEFLITFATSLIFSAAVFFPLQLRGSWAYFWLNYLCTLTTGIVLAYMFAALIPDMFTANAGLQVYCITLLFFSGFFILFDDMPRYWRWYSYTNFLSYAWSGLILNQFQDATETFGGREIMDYFGAPRQGGLNKWGHLGVEMGFCTFFFIIAWAAMSFCSHSRR